MKNKYGVMLEDGYQLYLNDLAVGDKKAVASHRVVDKVEVWICTVIMLYYMIWYDSVHSKADRSQLSLTQNIEIKS